MLSFKKIIIVFWALWWITAAATDIFGLLAHFQWIDKPWAPDINYAFLVTTLKTYPSPPWLVLILYIGIIAWSSFSASLFIFAALSLTQEKAIWLKRANWAFIVSLLLWFAFFLADQIVMKYDLEENHMVQGGFELLTFLSLYLLPDKS